MRNYFLAFSIPLLMLVGCSDDKDYYQKPEAPDMEAYKRFELTEKLNVSIDLVDSARCLIFDTYPFDENDVLTVEPILLGYSPIDATVIVGNDVTDLYLLTYKGLEKLPKENINITLNNSRAIGYPEGLKALVDRIYPEGKRNITEEEMKLSSDIVIVEDNTEVKLTFINNGGSVTNQVSFYTYTDTDSEPQDYHVIFENVKDLTVGEKFTLGTFNKGTKIGFKQFVSERMTLYSTPEFNEKYGAEKHLYSSAVMRKITYEGDNYITLGLEDRKYGQQGADYDYNDVLFLLETTPDADLENILPAPPIDKEKVEWAGIWLFEDNPLEVSDYDFNDLVIRYAYKEFTDGSQTQLTLEVLALGASYNNSFGVNGKVILSDLSGMVNVYAHQERDEFPAETYFIEKADEYVPFIKNKTGQFDLKTLNAGEHPNVLNIPQHKWSKFDFRWCLEQTPIGEAYEDFNNWVETHKYSYSTWYEKDPVPGTTFEK